MINEELLRAEINRRIHNMIRTPEDEEELKRVFPDQYGVILGYRAALSIIDEMEKEPVSASVASKTIMLRSRWEYTVMLLPDDGTLVDFLNKQGENEWELINVTPSHIGVFGVFKHCVMLNVETGEDVKKEFATIPVEEYDALKQCQQDCIDKLEREKQELKQEIFEKAINDAVKK